MELVLVLKRGAVLVVQRMGNLGDVSCGDSGTG